MDSTKPNGLLLKFRKWSPVVLGVLLTIASAVISNFFIDKNNDQVSEWERDAANVARQIEEIWENTRSLERRKDMAILLLVNKPEHPATLAFINDTFALIGNPPDQELTYDFIQNSFDDYKSEVIERIDDRYLTQQSFIEQVKLIKMDNDFLVSIALCFQILGVIFVLSRGGD